jgi:DNA-binding XRE family transcriptional regulator
MEIQFQEIQAIMALASGSRANYTVQLPKALLEKIKESEDHQSLVVAVLMKHFMGSSNGTNGTNGTNGSNASPAQRIINLNKMRNGCPKTLRQIRNERGLTMKALAKMAGIWETQISAYERGIHRPTAATKEKLAKALDMKVSDILWH